jgi:D-arginine dehydrogenase
MTVTAGKVPSSSPDVIIVGAGIAGCSVAWHLGSHCRVLVVEQGSEPCAEATAQSAGMVRNLVDDPVERVLVRRTLAFLQEPGEDFIKPPSRRTGAIISLARDPFALHDCVAHLRATGVRVEDCDRPWELAPMMKGAPPMQSWYLPDEHLADPSALGEGFVRGARRQGVEFHLDTRVSGLIVEGGQVRGVYTTAGELRADKVLIAAGAWSERLVHEFSLRRPLIPLSRSVFTTGASSDSTPDHPWCWVDDAGIYVRPHEEGWMCCPCDEQPVEIADGPGSAGATLERHQDLVRAKLSAYFPKLRDVVFQRSWLGIRTFAPDRRPVLGADPELPGLWWAAGIGGYGISCSYSVGEALAAWMLGRKTPWFGAELVSPGREHFSRWWILPEGDFLGATALESHKKKA